MTTQQLEAFVDRILNTAGGITSDGPTITKAGWCLRKGLIHILKANHGILLPLVERHGPPMFYYITPLQSPAVVANFSRHQDAASNNDRHDNTLPQSYFQSLCHVIVFQLLGTAAATTIWNRLIACINPQFTPETILQLASTDEDRQRRLQKPAGLSRGKAVAMVELAKAFQRGDLTEDFFHQHARHHDHNDEIITLRNALMQIKGIGPWTCDIFLLRYLQHPNVLPLGDLGIRKGISKWFLHWKPRTKNQKCTLCPKRDAQQIAKALEPYQPFQSLVSYYMWKAADSDDLYPSPSMGNNNLHSAEKESSNSDLDVRPKPVHSPGPSPSQRNGLLTTKENSSSEDRSSTSSMISTTPQKTAKSLRERIITP